MLAQREEHQPPIHANASFGVASLKEIVLSSRFSRFFLLGLPWPRTYLLRRSRWLLFERLRHDSRSVHARATNSSVDRSRSIHRVRSQSFLSSRLHPNSSLRVSACLTVSAQAAWSQAA